MKVGRTYLEEAEMDAAELEEDAKTKEEKSLKADRLKTRQCSGIGKYMLVLCGAPFGV